MHEKLWQIVRRLNTDYEPFGKAEREGADCSGGCRRVQLHRPPMTRAMVGATVVNKYGIFSISPQLSGPCAAGCVNEIKVPPIGNCSMPCSGRRAGGLYVRGRGILMRLPCAVRCTRLSRRGSPAVPQQVAGAMGGPGAGILAWKTSQAWGAWRDTKKALDDRANGLLLDG